MKQVMMPSPHLLAACYVWRPRNGAADYVLLHMPEGMGRDLACTCGVVCVVLFG